MAHLVIASNNKAMRKLDRSVKSKVMDFIEKLNSDDTASGLHIEPIQASKDPRIRTARVDLHYRAILFKIDDKLGETTYIYMGTWPHDEANSLAERSVLRVNPVNGVLEGIIGEPIESDDRQKLTPVRATRGESRPSSYLAGLGFSLDDLTSRLGLDAEISERAFDAPSQDAVFEIAQHAVVWQGSAITDLITGISIDDIRTKHGLDETAQPDANLDEDEQILEALKHPASQLQFAYIEDDEELRRVIESGDFGAWRTFLHPEQRKYADAYQNGSFRLSGGAGTGKTVVAIHRARKLTRENPSARIILTTFNKTLAMGLESDLKALEPSAELATNPGTSGVYVKGVDALAKAVLDQADNLDAACKAVLGASVDTHGRNRSDKVWREAVKAADNGLDKSLASPSFLEDEYVAVILANSVTTLEEYSKVARPGRGVRLTRPQRIAVWQIVEEYRRHNRTAGTISFPEVLALAAESLRLSREAGNPHLAEHVIIDEAQDLHATHWALLRALVDEGPNDLFIAEDSHQRIYGRPVVLSRLGIKIVGRSRRLTLNYRTTAQNLNFAVGILAGAEYRDLETGAESTSEYRSARSGPIPKMVECTDQSDELDQVAQHVYEWIEDGIVPETIAVLTRSHDDRLRFVDALEERSVEARALDNNPPTPGYVQVLTMHRSKGMEFSRVVLASVDDANIPSAASLKAVTPEDREEALLRERSLLYVAASRARDELVVTWSGRRSELLGKN
ncbi:3'-5' exonuclease [Rhodococcus sp. ARC_M6]|uniref:3'-5' exonuclease n=1 Tax=Rhodococcus sp. ARC_M6 TaxID=2928852 RepID=UPI001FB35F78|nr:3'-5' exonuclease [Rhodococcus sp. ARC_M6]MCJ0906094.1 AAA family ATPase [Rhodococcus sp. ARC_M6]